MGKIMQRRTVLLSGVALGLTVSMKATRVMAQDKTKVGFIYVGPIGDLAGRTSTIRAAWR